MHRPIENIPYPIEPTTIPTINPTNFIYTNNYCTKDDRKINKTKYLTTPTNIRRSCHIRKRYSLFLQSRGTMDVETFRYDSNNNNINNNKNNKYNNINNNKHNLLVSTTLKNIPILIRATGNNFDQIEVLSLNYDDDKRLYTNCVQCKGQWRVYALKKQNLALTSCAICRKGQGICNKPNEPGHLQYDTNEDSIVDIQLFRVSEEDTKINFCFRTLEDMIYYCTIQTTENNNNNNAKQMSSPLATKPGSDYEEYIKQRNNAQKQQMKKIPSITTTTMFRNDNNNNNNNNRKHIYFDDSSDSDDNDGNSNRKNNNNNKNKSNDTTTTNNNNKQSDAKDYKADFDLRLRWTCNTIFNFNSTAYITSNNEGEKGEEELKQQQHPILTMATSPHSNVHLFIMYENATMILFHLKIQMNSNHRIIGIPSIFHRLSFKYDVALPNQRIMSNFQPYCISSSYGLHPLKVFIGYKNKLYNISFRSTSQNVMENEKLQVCVFTLPKRNNNDLKYPKEVISTVKRTKYKFEIVIGTNYSIYIINACNNNIADWNIVHSWNHCFNDMSTALMINHITSIPFQHYDPFIKSTSHNNNNNPTNDDEQTSMQINGEIYMGVSFLHPQVLFCPRIVQPNTIDVHKEDLDKQYKRWNSGETVMDHRDFLMSRETIVPQKFHIKRTWDAMNHTDQQFYNFIAPSNSSIPETWKLNYTIEEKSNYLKGACLISNIQINDDKKDNEFVFCILDDHGNTYIDECKLLVHKENSLFPIKIKQKMQRLPVGINIHGKIDFEKPIVYDDDHNMEQEDNIVVNRDVVLPKFRDIFQREDSDDLYFKEIQDLSSGIDYANILKDGPKAIFDIACEVYKYKETDLAKKLNAKKDLTYDEISEMVHHVIKLSVDIEQDIRRRKNTPQNLTRTLIISDKLSLPLPSRITYIANNRNVRVSRTHNMVKIKTISSGIGPKKPPQLTNVFNAMKNFKHISSYSDLENDARSDASKFSENIRTYFNTILYLDPRDNGGGSIRTKKLKESGESNMMDHNDDDSNDDDDDNDDDGIDVEHFRLLDTLKSLWDNNNAEEYVASMKENVKRKQKNVTAEQTFQIHVRKKRHSSTKIVL